MALLKGKIKHFREVPSNELLDFDTAVDYEFTLEDEIIAYDEVKKLHAALGKLETLESEIIKRYYILNQTLGEIAMDSDKNYHQFARMKKNALAKLRSLL